MTLIATYIAKHGIIHATDSNITNTNTTGLRYTTPGKKLFPISELQAALSLAGSYGVGGVKMDEWMPAFIAQQSTLQGITLRSFANNLRTELEAQMTSVEKEVGSMVHIAGYVLDGVEYHPEFWYVRNVHRINEVTGNYEDVRNDFICSEDWWARDVRVNTNIDQGGYYLYTNGLTSGRKAFNAINFALFKSFTKIWHEGGELKPPATPEDTERMVKVFMSATTTLFEISGIQAPVIGGDIQTLVIAAPPNTINVPR